MTSETQTVIGVTGEFTLNYTYKPGGALASVEDPFDRVVSYSYDKTGQLTSVGGTNYPNVSSFISSIQYRAWGRAKSVSYGNGVDENTEFNERMLLTEYELTDLRLIDNSIYTDTSTLDYYDDGSLFHAFYATGNTKFDRKLDYDFAGRIKEAYTGREAHDQSPLNPRDNPYRQSFQYDAFGNMTQRSGFLWRKTMPTDSDTYTNNQRSEWGYDAAGNVVYTDSGTGAFDSAGQKHFSTSSQTDDLGSGNYRRFDAVISHSLDGEGWLRGRSEYRYVEQSIGEDFDFTEDTTDQHFLWSSVLGAVVAELNDDDELTTAFVFAGKRVASLEITPSSSSVYFRASNPQTGTTYRTDYTGKGGRQEEFDPLRAQLPKTDPYISQQRLYSDLKPPGKLFMNDANPYAYDNSCSWDGIPTPCEIVNGAWASGAGDRLVDADVYIKYRTADNKTYVKTFSGKVTSSLGGLNVVWTGDTAGRAERGFVPAFPRGMEAGLWAASMSAEVELVRNWRFSESSQSRSLQKPTGVMAPIGGLDRMQMWLEEALKYRDCREAMQKLVAQIASDTKFAASHTDILDLFNALRAQTGGGGIFVDVPWGTSNTVFPRGAIVGEEGAGGGGVSAIFYTDPSNWRTRQRTSIVYLKGAYSDSQPLAFKQLPYFYVGALIHELTHNAPNDSSEAGRYYEHKEMDAAAKTLGSTSLDQYVKEHCIPKKYW
jgi:YD repeat-containing protein